MSITVSVELQPLLQHFHFITEHYERRLVFLGVIPNGKAGPTGQSRTTSNISHCMSVPGQRKGGRLGGSIQDNIHSNLKRTFIRSNYRDCLSTWQTAKLIKLLLV